MPNIVSLMKTTQDYSYNILMFLPRIWLKMFDTAFGDFYENTDSSSRPVNTIKTREIQTFKPDPSLQLDLQVIAFIDDIEKYFENRIKSMRTRIEQAPVLKTSLDSAEICLNIIKMMQDDYSVIAEHMKLYMDLNNRDAIAKVQQVLICYLVGFLFNLNKILNSYEEIMSLVVDKLDIPPHRYDRDLIKAKNEVLLQLTSNLISDPLFQENFGYIVKYNHSSKWQVELTDNLLKVDDPIINRLLINLRLDRAYDYQQLLFEQNKCEIMADLYAKDDQTGVVVSKVLFLRWQQADVHRKLREYEEGGAPACVSSPSSFSTYSL